MEHLAQANPERFQSKASLGLACVCPRVHRWQSLGGLCALALRRCREDACGTAKYMQCKEAVNLDRKIRKGF